MHQSDNPPAALVAAALAGLGPVRHIPVALLRAADSPRLAGPDENHARQLAQAGASLRPIIVHGPTLRVIDGTHRLRAAVLRGASTIEARCFDGPEPDAFVLAVAANAEHGLPLCLADRTGAAVRILGSHPQWSDRSVAGVTGLAPGTVANLRRRTADPDPADLAVSARIGRDGRVRPLDAAAGRRRAAEVIERWPEASLREIAARAGISAGTARDVRERIRRGEDAVRRRPRRGPGPEGPPRGTRPVPDAAPREAPTAAGQTDLLRSLCRDPSFRHNESGRLLLRMLETHAVGMAQRERIIDSLPAHWAGSVSAVALSCAEEWRRFAVRVEELSCVA